MAFAITKVQAYGQEAEEPINKRYRQFLMLTLTAANTNTTWDFGANQTGSLGTFWTAVSGTDIGANALLAIQDIVTRCEQFASFGGEWMSRAQIDPSAGQITTYDSATSTGGAATEQLTVTGLAVADTILAVTEQTKGANGTALIAWTDTARTVNKLDVEWTANPGAGSIVRVLVQKAGTTTPGAGTYTVSYSNHTPNITFASGDAPTTAEVTLEWVLQPQVSPVEYYQST